MSDLPSRLRTEPFMHWELRHEAAARIEELEAAQDTINSIAVHQQTLRIAELQARVEVLEGALQKIRTEPGDARDCRYIAGQALAATEQEGET